MMSDFRGGGRGGLKFWIIEGKNRIKGGGGVKNDSKISAIIYERSLRVLNTFETVLAPVLKS